MKVCAKDFPVAFDALLEAKMFLITRQLPEGGTLADYPGLRSTLEWLALRGILEGLLGGGGL